MAFNIEIDYRFDTRGFFDDPARRAAVEEAAQAWEVRIGDEFTDIPAGTVLSGFLNPETYGRDDTITLDRPIDDLLIFFGATDNLPPIASGLEAGARGGPAFGGLSGDIFLARFTSDFRGTGPVTDFEPWVGTVSFNARIDWSSVENIKATAIHEIGHVLGIGASPAFDALQRDGMFFGENAVRLNGGAPIPLSADLSHVAEGFADNSVALDVSGGRDGVSEFDAAILADIGYQIEGFVTQGTTPPLATAEGEVIFGTRGDDVIDGLGGADQIVSNGGNDILLGGSGDDTLFGAQDSDILVGGDGNDFLLGSDGRDLLVSISGSDDVFGEAGTDSFVVIAGGGLRYLWDFDPVSEVIYLVDGDSSGIQQILSREAEPFLDTAQLTLADGTQINISGGKGQLSAQNVVLVVPKTGGAGRDTFANSDTLDFISGGEGLDTMLYGGTGAGFEARAGLPGEVAVRDVSTGMWDLLSGIERLQFSDGTLAFDAAGIAGQAYRLYQASFDRIPDAEGLGFWVGALDSGAVSLVEAAGYFMSSEEYGQAYGAAETQSYEAFLTLLYANVLDRTPDEAGFAFWRAQEDNGVSRAETLAYFSESTENIAKTASAVDDGIWFA